MMRDEYKESHMTITSDFWRWLHELGAALEFTSWEECDRETLDALRADFERLPIARQCELRREMQNVIVGLARLDAQLPLDSLTGACLSR